MWMIILSFLSVFKDLNLNLMYETVVGSGLLEGGSGRLPPLQNDNFS